MEVKKSLFLTEVIIKIQPKIITVALNLIQLNGSGRITRTDVFRWHKKEELR